MFMGCTKGKIGAGGGDGFGGLGDDRGRYGCGDVGEDGCSNI